ncbi:MAG: molybdenum cofactor biosynthesis protein B [Pirellulales bacterium]
MADPVSKSTTPCGVAPADGSIASPAAEHREAAPQDLKIGIVTISDTRTLETDKSGTLLVERFTAAGYSPAYRSIVRDEITEIRAAVSQALLMGLDALILTGGTGIAPRDRTPEAVVPMFDVELPGFGELFRMLSYEEIGPASMLSRAVAGRVERMLVFCLPGSTNAVRLAADKLLVTELAHLVHHSRG